MDVRLDGSNETCTWCLVLQMWCKIRQQRNFPRDNIFLLQNVKQQHGGLVKIYVAFNLSGMTNAQLQMGIWKFIGVNITSVPTN
jgi:hypothetical protein